MITTPYRKSCHLTEALILRLRALAALENITLSAIIRQCIAAGLDVIEKKWGIFNA